MISNLMTYLADYIDQPGYCSRQKGRSSVSLAQDPSEKLIEVLVAALKWHIKSRSFKMTAKAAGKVCRSP
jgi:hypothetical protein